MISLNNKDLIVFIILSIIEYLCVYMFFDNYALFPKILLIILLIYIIQRFNIHYVLINCIYIISLIMVFYKTNKNKNNESYENYNNSSTIENFTSKLQDFKNKEKFKSIFT